MKQEEISYLKSIKRSNGLSEIQIFKDIDNLNNSQYTFKNINHQITKLKKIIDSKNKKIKQLEDKIKKNKEINFKKKFKEIGKEENNKGSIANLHRIVRNMEKGKYYTQTDISHEFLMGNDEAKGCLNFLKEINLVDCRKDQNTKRYFLK